MGVEAHVYGADEWAAAADALMVRVRTATDGAVDDGLALIQVEAQRNLSLTSHPPRTPTPAGPGEPPSLISGALRRAMKVRRDQRGPDVYSGAVGPAIIYGPIQERGGWAGAGHRSYLPPRPYLRPARTTAIPKIRKLFADAWARAIRG